MEINKLYNEDCIITMNNMVNNKLLVDLVITSPPYDNLRTYNRNIKNNHNGYSFQFEEIAKLLYKIIKPNGVLVWIVGDSTLKGSETGNSFRQALYFKEIGFDLHDTMIYQKNSSTYPASRKSNRYTQIFEYMFVFSKGKPKTANLICDKPNKWAGHKNWGKNTKRTGDNEQLKQIEDIKPVPDFSPRNNIWIYNNGGGFASKDKIAYNHPAIFPEELVKDHIITWSNENDLIYDPFMGSGTTAKISIQLGRNWIGSELDSTYSNIIDKRLQGITKLESHKNIG